MVECFPLGSSSIGRTSGMWVLGLAVSLGDAWALHRVVLRPPAGLPPEQHLRELPVAGAQGASANSLQAFWGRFSAGFTQAFSFPTFRKRESEFPQLPNVSYFGICVGASWSAAFPGFPIVSPFERGRPAGGGSHGAWLGPGAALAAAAATRVGPIEPIPSGFRAIGF